MPEAATYREYFVEVLDKRGVLCPQRFAVSISLEATYTTQRR